MSDWACDLPGCRGLFTTRGQLELHRLNMHSPVVAPIADDRCGELVAAWGYGELLFGHITMRYDFDSYQIRLAGTQSYRIVPTADLRSPTAADIQVWFDRDLTTR